MADGIHANDEGRHHPDDFGRRVRRFALDAHRILGRPDSPLDELIELHARAFHLLDEVPGTRASGILGWLLAVRQRIGARLQSWSVEDLEFLLA
jgi:hypothetical protein